MVASTSLVRFSTVLASDVRRQGLSNVLHLGIDRGGDRAAVGADEHERGADDDFLAVFAGTAGAQLLADADRGHVVDVDRGAVARCR